MHQVRYVHPLFGPAVPVAGLNDELHGCLGCSRNNDGTVKEESVELRVGEVIKKIYKCKRNIFHAVKLKF
ncbi:MAG: hypothetical protein DRP70_15405 [Spirochaetes bacterium]|nr:MAG: hypothetical protein DRP70_15405 [Spirochaetota bacterium]